MSQSGIFINAMNSEDCWAYYGHFYTEIPALSIEQVFDDLEVFFKEWTDKKRIKNRILEFLQCRKRYCNM